PDGYTEVRVAAGEDSRLERRESDPNQLVDVLSFSPGQMGPGKVEVVWLRNLSEEELRTTRVVTDMRVPAGTMPKVEMTADERRAAGERVFVEVARAKERSPDGPAWVPAPRPR
ncbi:MAG TPA: hypothetical protein VFU47_05905, partial [Armatimonadota bacterium]|nr:hypothetical protein [Armatimonadota bacterium]